MDLTVFGLVIAALGVGLLFNGGVLPLLLLEMGCSLLGGSAAVSLSAIGGSSVPPAQFALLFGIARIVMPGSGRLRRAGEALRANAFLGGFTLYALLAAAFAPVFFRGLIRVPAMRGTGPTRTLYDTVPLAASPQNITASVYIIGSFCAGILAFVAMQEYRAPQRFVKMAVIIAWVHISLGVLAAALKGTPFDLFVDFMRNANYTQTDQSVEGVVRLTGIFTEPSAYASFAFGWFVFLLECWLRDVLPRRTGPAALAMGLLLICSTSSAAYIGLALYVVLFLLRILLAPQLLDARKGLILGISVLVAAVMISAAVFLLPAALDTAVSILQSATIGKQQSESALQRAFWAKTGIDAFFASDGIGIGPGSFRSSSFFTAVIGSVGVVGSGLLAAHLLRAFKPLRISTYSGPHLGRHFGEEAMIGAAAVWAAIGVLLPAAVASPTCDPGADFAVFTAVALALRRVHPAKFASAQFAGADRASAGQRPPSQAAYSQVTKPSPFDPARDDPQ